MNKRILPRESSKALASRKLAAGVRQLIEATGLGEQIPSSSFKAELERRGAADLAKLGFPEHIPYVDFKPALFTLQRHWWGAKSHWDIRIIESGSPLWFGFETFSDPRLATKDRPCKGMAKGLLAYFLARADLESKFQRKGKPAGENKPEGAAREIAWLWSEGKINPGESGNPTKDKPGGIVLLEKLKPAVLHRRSYDTIDTTFLGFKLQGRYLLRLIKDPQSGEFRFSFRRFAAENQFPLDVMRQISVKGSAYPSLLSEKANLKNFQALSKPSVFKKPRYPAEVRRRVEWLE